jgi:hypothetical protein
VVVDQAGYFLHGDHGLHDCKVQVPNQPSGYLLVNALQLHDDILIINLLRRLTRTIQPHTVALSRERVEISSG